MMVIVEPLRKFVSQAKVERLVDSYKGRAIQGFSAENSTHSLAERLILTDPINDSTVANCLMPSKDDEKRTSSSA